MEYLNHLDQSLPVFNLSIIIGKIMCINKKINSYKRKNVIKETINNPLL